VKLTWDLLSEKDVSYYVIEKSTNGIDYENIAKVPSAGNSLRPGTYFAFDEHPAIGNNYYRLNAVDKNGVQNVAAHTMVTNKSTMPYFNIFPNPTAGTLNLNLGNFSSPAITIDIFDMYGKLVWSSQLNLDNGAYQQQLDLNSFSDGIYYVKTSDGENMFKKSLVIAKGNN
jgi:hypothetical protein